MLMLNNQRVIISSSSVLPFPGAQKWPPAPLRPPLDRLTAAPAVGAPGAPLGGRGQCGHQGL